MCDLCVSVVDMGGVCHEHANSLAIFESFFFHHLNKKNKYKLYMILLLTSPTTLAVSSILSLRSAPRRLMRSRTFGVLQNRLTNSLEVHLVS